MKYLVMERHESYVVVLDENGRFYKAANMDYSPGQTLTDIEPMRNIKSVKRKRRGLLVLLVVLLVLVAAGIYFLLASGGENLKVFRFYMGGEVAVTCDSENNVEKVEGLDEAGKAVAQVDSGNKDITQLSIEMLENAYSLGYIERDSEIFVAIENEYDDDNPILELTADILEDYAEDKYDIEVEKSSWDDYQEDTAKEKYKEIYRNDG